MRGFQEVAERVWVSRYEWVDANVTAIGSDRGVVVVDTHASTAAGRVVLEDLRRLSAGPLAAVVNTHWHWDHCFGNAAFREASPGIPIHAHEDAAAMLTEQGACMQESVATSEAAHGDEVVATEIVVPDHTFSSTRVLDLGDRTLELIFPGRGHTSGDIVVRLPDVDVMLAGDLVEESDKPWIGLDSYPFDWPGSLDLVVAMATGATRIVPGHGVPVDRAFVDNQRDELVAIAETVRMLAGSGVPVERAVAEGDWPWERDERIANAVTRGYEALPPSGRALPLA